MRRLLSLLIVLAVVPGALSAQQWNAPDALTLVHRAVERRELAQADTSLRSYRTLAHGFVFFLAQVGEGFTEPPRLVKADELKVEVYWQAPDRSKQIIRGWRDGTWLPNDTRYHRDHLGIVTNNFGDRIRIGEGDEVRDVIHPLSPAGLERYDFALGDSLTIASGDGRRLTVRSVEVRPREFGSAAVVGRLFIDAGTAELVRFRFSFTPAAYLDKDLEDISIVLENSLWEGRYWLPYRQEIQIRRRSSFLDLPARGIIRGRWEIDDYDLGAEIPAQIFAGPAIGGLREATPAARTAGDTTWGGSLDSAIAGVAQPLNAQDMEALRVEVQQIAGTRALSGLPSKRFGANSISDIARVNRVQGLALGFGASLGLGRSSARLRPYLAYGTSDDRLLGSLELSAGAGATQLSASGYRRIRDFSDVPIISPLLNSILAQEAGDDRGDYVLVQGVQAGVRRQLSGRTALGLELGIEESRSVAVSSSPANGTYRPNPALGAGSYRVARLRLERAAAGFAARQDLEGTLSVEGGEGPTEYLRAALAARWQARLGGSELLARLHAGIGTDGLPAYRSFVMGGWGTLPGEPFRAFGGRRAALAHLEWRFDVPFPAIPLGSFASTGDRATLAPFVAAGATGGGNAALGGASDGIRPVAGVAAELFMRLLRIEAGVGLRTGDVQITVDVARSWWGLL